MHTFYLPSDNLDVITVSGPDAVKFLQGQLTCDVEAIPEPGSTRGALCNNKGRVLATFILVRHNAVFHLVMNKGVGDMLVATLKKYLPFYKCEFRQVSGADSGCVGLVGDAAALAFTGLTALPNDGECVATPDGWLCTVSRAHQQYLCHMRTAPSLPSNIAVGTQEQWILTGMLAGIYPFVPDDVEKYTPQELHLDRHGFVSFTKGCYTGQEIVARMHYRGKQKKLLFLLQAPLPDSAAASEPMDIVDESGQRVSSTQKILRDAKSIYGLVVLPAEMEQAMPAIVKNSEGTQFSLRPF